MARLCILLLLCISRNVTCIDFTPSPSREVVLGTTGTLAMTCAVTECDVAAVYTVKIKRAVSPGSNTYELLAHFISGSAVLDSGITNNRDFEVTGSLSDSPPYLQLTMNISKLLCSDVMTYTCEAGYESSTTGQIKTPEKNVTLQAFVLPTMTSLVATRNNAFVDGGSSSEKALFDVGDELVLSCKANIGSLDSTKIRWRKRSETCSGFIEYQPTAGTFTEGRPLDDNQCGYDRTATIRYNTTAADSSYDLAFECYVSVSGYPSSTSTPSGVYTTTNSLQYHLNVSGGTQYSPNGSSTTGGTTLSSSGSRTHVACDYACTSNTGAFVGVAIGSVAGTLFAVGIFVVIKRHVWHGVQERHGNKRSMGRYKKEVTRHGQLTTADESHIYINEDNDHAAGANTEYENLHKSTKDLDTYSQIETEKNLI